MNETPLVLEHPDELFMVCDRARYAGLHVGFVPTMGALHEGHLTLVDAALERTNFVVVSIFVNPTQFGPNEDFDAYPRDVAGDIEKLHGRGVKVVFKPQVATMYPQGHRTKVSVSGLTEGLCGAYREGHFDGVTTIVAKLFNMVGPCTAVFGRKDYQQFRVLQKMTEDLNMPQEIIGAPTLREPDGLAMSSRNAYLSNDERERALAIARGLSAAHKLYASGKRNVGVLRRAVLDSVEAVADSIDYVSAVDPHTLAPLSEDGEVEGNLLIAVAARIGKTRLIDNTELGQDTPPIR